MSASNRKKNILWILCLSLLVIGIYWFFNQDKKTKENAFSQNDSVEEDLPNEVISQNKKIEESSDGENVKPADQTKVTESKEIEEIAELSPEEKQHCLEKGQEYYQWNIFDELKKQDPPPSEGSTGENTLAPILKNFLEKVESLSEMDQKCVRMPIKRRNEMLKMIKEVCRERTAEEINSEASQIEKRIIENQKKMKEQLGDKFTGKELTQEQMNQQIQMQQNLGSSLRQNSCAQSMIALKEQMMSVYLSTVPVENLETTALNLEYNRSLKELKKIQSSGTALTGQQLKRFKETSKEMYKRNPQDRDIQKSLILSELYSGVYGNEENTQQKREDQDLAYQLIEDGRREHPEDIGLIESKIVYHAKEKDYQALTDYAQELRLQSQKYKGDKKQLGKASYLSYKAHELEAFASYKAGDKKKAITILDRHLKDHPNDFRAIILQKKLEQTDLNNPEHRPFNFNVQIQLPAEESN